MLNITATQLKIDLSKYLAMAFFEDITVTKNGKPVAMITSPLKKSVSSSLLGIIPDDLSEEMLKEERLKKYENID